MPCSEGAADPCASSSMIATVCQDGDTAGVPPLWNRLGVVISSRVTGGLVEAKAAVAQHVEYMSVRAEPAEEGASRHGKARRRYTSAGRGSKAEHLSPKPQKTTLPSEEARECRANGCGASRHAKARRLYDGVGVGSVVTACVVGLPGFVASCCTTACAIVPE